MITISQLTELLGWASVINIGILIFMTIALSTIRKVALNVHSKMFGIPEGELNIVYFKYLANFKMLTTIFILVPYLSLKIMGQ